MKALVTGATGFVGSHLAEALRRRGDDVTVLARSARKAQALEPLGVRVVSGDLRDTAALARAAEGQDEIYHVAGVVAARNEAEFLAANRDGTANVVAAAAAAGRPRLVLVSSMAAGGPSLLFEAAAMGCNVVASPNCGYAALCNDALLAPRGSVREFLERIRPALSRPYVENRDPFPGGTADLVETLAVV